MLRRQFMVLGAAAAAGCRSGQNPPPSGTVQPGANSQPALSDFAMSTHVVRLIVGPTAITVENPNDISAANQTTIRDAAFAQGATPMDVFILKTAGGWQPFSLVDGISFERHELAVTQHPETIAKVKAVLAQQIQWECELDFEISNIKKSDSALPDFQNGGSAPDDPFKIPVKGKGGGLGKPVRSGVVHSGWAIRDKQMYKLTFTIKINGNAEVIDPDIYCEWG